jgi:diguanylate cyclase (GGDEF)-like protein
MAFKSIRSRLLIGYVSVVVIILVVGSIGLYSRTVLVESQERMNAITSKNERMQKLTLAIEKLLMPANDFLITEDKEAELERYWERLEDVNEIVAGIEPDDSEKRFLLELGQTIEDIKAKAEGIFALASWDDPEGIRLMQVMDKSAERAHEILNKRAGVLRQELDVISQSSGRTFEFVNRSMMAGAVIVILFSVMFVLYQERSIRNPIERLSKGVKELSRGRWNKIRVNEKDGMEVSNLASEFNNMVDSLHSAYESLERKASEVEQRTSALNKLNKSRETLSITDGLTGLYNHRHFYDRLEEEIESSKRYEKPFSVLMIDIDHFKLYNDRNGHVEGDGVLKDVAGCLLKGARDVDIVFRYGGEEFAVIAQEIEIKGALVFAERIRKFVEDRDFPNEDTQPGGGLTVSIGVSVFPVDAKELKGIVNKADQALYKAKQGGRNQVVAA